MAIEIGSLVVRGSFGTPTADKAASTREIERRIEVMRRKVLDEVDQRLARAERRKTER